MTANSPRSTVEIADVQAQLADGPAPAAPAVDPPATLPTTTPTTAPSSIGADWLKGLTKFLTPAPASSHSDLQAQLELLQQRRSNEAASQASYDRWHQVAFALLTPLPKTSETVQLISWRLYAAADLPRGLEDDSALPAPGTFQARLCATGGSPSK